jgi:hypothetical protein
MEQEKIVNNISSLPVEAQQQVADFIDLLKIRYSRSRKEKQINRNNLVNEPFIGIWKDRKDMTDSSEWLRNVRKTEWNQNNLQ